MGYVKAAMAQAAHSSGRLVQVPEQGLLLCLSGDPALLSAAVLPLNHTALGGLVKIWGAARMNIFSFS